jgi:hypothetical protein
MIKGSLTRQQVWATVSLMMKNTICMTSRCSLIVVPLQFTKTSTEKLDKAIWLTNSVMMVMTRSKRY